MRSGSTPRRMRASSTASPVAMVHDGSAAPTSPTKASGQRASNTSATSDRPMPGCRTSRSATSPVAIPASATRRHDARRRAARSRTSRQARRSRATATRRSPGAARDRQDGEADGVASLHDPMAQSAPPAPPESLPAPNTSTAASSAHPGPARALSPRGHRRHAPLEARGDVGVARCQQRRDHAPLLGGGLDRSPARRHRRACRSCWSARTTAILPVVKADCSWPR